ncbi:MAG: hypothetical protein JRI68_11480 [Deltaproteobacteria bacterium]|nr:hypothetical protein [Deltaproteobacteria bacterium]
MVIDPDDPSHLVAAGAAAGGVWHTRAGGPPGWHPANPPGAGYASRRARRLLWVEHPSEGRSLVVQVEAVDGDAGQALYRVAWAKLREGPTKALAVAGQPLAVATDPHRGRRGRIAALVLGGGGGSLAYSDDAGDRWRRFHPSGRCHLTQALAFGSDRHLWMASLGSVPGSKASQADTTTLMRMTQALADGEEPPGDGPQLDLLREPALLAIHPDRGEVTERLALPTAAHSISVHPDLKGIAWLGGRQGLMRLHAGRVRSVPLQTTTDRALEPPLELAGITLFPDPVSGTEQLFVALTGEPPARRGIWLGQRQDGQWRFERVSEGASKGFPDLPAGPVTVSPEHQLAVVPYGTHGIRRSHALGALGTWAPVQ